MSCRHDVGVTVCASCGIPRGGSDRELIRVGATADVLEALDRPAHVVGLVAARERAGLGPWTPPEPTDEGPSRRKHGRRGPPRDNRPSRPGPALR